MIQTLADVPPSDRHAFASERLAELIGRQFGGDLACWDCAREAFALLGLDLPAGYAQARDYADNLGELGPVRPDPGDLIVFERDGSRPHLAVCLGAGLAIHAGDETSGRVLVDGLEDLLRGGASARVLRPRAFRGATP